MGFMGQFCVGVQRGTMQDISPHGKDEQTKLFTSSAFETNPRWTCNCIALLGTGLHFVFITNQASALRVLC